MSSYLPTRANQNLKITVRHVATDQSVSFTGWVTGFTDAFTSDWNETPVYGRMDNLATFKRTGRKIQLAFEVVSEDARDAALNNRDLDKLASYLYPVYETTKKVSQNVLVAAPLLELSWTNMIQDQRLATRGLIGYLRGFAYEPLVEEGMFNFQDGANILWKYFTVNLDFTVLHTYLPGWARENNSGAWSYGGPGPGGTNFHQDPMASRTAEQRSAADGVTDANREQTLDELGRTQAEADQDTADILQLVERDQPT